MTDELNWSHQLSSLHGATPEERFNLLGQQEELHKNPQEDQNLATSVGDPHSQRNEYDPNWLHQKSFLSGNQRSQAAPITEQRFGRLGQQEELQNNSQEGQYQGTSTGCPYSQRNDYELNLQNQISLSRSRQHGQAVVTTNQLFGLSGQQAELQNNSQEGQYQGTSTGCSYSQRNEYELNLQNQIILSRSRQHVQARATTNQPFGLSEQQADLQNNSQQRQYLATSTGDPSSQRNDHEPYWLCPRSYTGGNQCSQGAAIFYQQFDIRGQQEEPHLQRNGNKANWAQEISFQQSNQFGLTLLGPTSNRAGSLIPSQVAEVTEQPSSQCPATSTGDCQNSGKFSEEDQQRLDEIKKKGRRAQISQEEENLKQELQRKRKRMHDNNYRQKKKKILEEKDRTIQQQDQHIVVIEAANKELERQLDERAKKVESMESKMEELYKEVERLQAEIRSLKSDYVSANERVQHFSLELAELGNHFSDEQPNVTPPENTQTHCMEQRNGTGRKPRTSSTIESETVDEESNSKPKFLHHLLKGFKYLKEKYERRFI